MYSVQVEFGSAYELCASLEAYISTNLYNAIDLAREWRSEVKEQLTFDPQTLRKQAPDVGIPFLPVVRYAPEKEALRFINWLADLSTGDMYAVLAEISAGGAIPQREKLERAQELLVNTLALWYEQYFATIDSRILSGLESEAGEKEAACRAMSPDDLVYWATGGIRVRPASNCQSIILVPQYHCRPWNLYTYFGENIIYQFPAESIDICGSDIPPKVRRLSRALSDESRLRILKFLGSASLPTFSDVVRHLGLSKSTVHHHLVVLRAAGLVSVYIDPPNSDRYGLRDNVMELVGPVFGRFLEVM